MTNNTAAEIIENVLFVMRFYINIHSAYLLEVKRYVSGVKEILSTFDNFINTEHFLPHEIFTAYRLMQISQIYRQIYLEWHLYCLKLQGFVDENYAIFVKLQSLSNRLEKNVQ